MYEFWQIVSESTSFPLDDFTALEFPLLTYLIPSPHFNSFPANVSIV